MDIKTLEQALKLQKDITTRLTQSLVSQGTGKMPTVAVLLKEKEQLVARAQVELETAINERNVAISRWDERVALRKANVGKLQKEMDEFKGQLTEGKGAPKVARTGKTTKNAPVKKSHK